MNFVIAIDSFKGSLTSIEAGNAAAEGIRAAVGDAHIKVCPVADGGEGTSEAIASALNAEKRIVCVSDPLDKRISAEYFVSGNTAIIEVASAAGITLISESERNPLLTTTYGVGEIISDAIHAGCRNFIVGLGGSATNDGGIGMLKALGFEFKDADGNEIENGAQGLKNLAAISCENAIPHLSECRFCVACDVTNPLCGEYGASRVFGIQKGASKETAEYMDKLLERFAALTMTVNSDADPNLAGAGAAGGLGFAFTAYLNAQLRRGIDIVIRETRLEDYIASADFVITGEGRLDSQSVMGKTPVGIAKIAKKYGKPVIAFSGCTAEGAKECNKAGIDAFFPILQEVCTLEEAMNKEHAFKNLRNTAEQVFRLVQLLGHQHTM